MEYKVVRRLPDEAAQFLRETYSMNLTPLSKGYIYLYSVGERGVNDVWMVNEHPIFDRLDLGLFKRVGFRVFRRKGRHIILSNTFIQVFGGYMERNLVVVRSGELLRELLQKTYIVLDGDIGDVVEVGHTDYPYKILRYEGLSIGLVKKHPRGYLSLLPRKYSEVEIL